MTKTQTDWDTDVVPARVVRAINRTLAETGVFEPGVDLDEIVVDGVAFILGSEFGELDDDALMKAVRAAIAQKFPPS